MNFVCHDSDGRITETGQLPTSPNVPTHGSVCIEVAPGRWLSIRTSEWVIVEEHPRQFTWKDANERIMKP